MFIISPTSSKIVSFVRFFQFYYAAVFGFQISNTGMLLFSSFFISWLANSDIPELCFVMTRQQFPIVLLFFQWHLSLTCCIPFLFIVCFSPQECKFHEGRDFCLLFCSMMYPQTLDQFLKHSRCSINMERMNGIVLELKERTLHILANICYLCFYF